MSRPPRPIGQGPETGFLGGPILKDTRSLRQRFGIVIGLSIVTNLLALVQPVFMLHVYDYVLPSRSLPTLGWLTLIAVFLLVVMGALEFLRTRIFADMAWELDEQLRPVCFKASYEAGKKGNRTGRAVFATDLETVKQFVAGPSPGAFLDLPWTFIFLGALFMLNPWLGLLSTVFAVLVLIFAVINEVSIRGYIAEGSRRGIRAQRIAEDVFLATDAVESMRFQKSAVGRWSGEAEAQAAFSRATTARGGIWTSVVRTLRMALQVFTLAAAAWLVLEGQLTSGAMIAASIIGARALAPIDSAVAGWRGIAAARISWQRLGNLVASSRHEDLPKTDPPATIGNLEAEGVTVTAESGMPIIGGIHIRVPAGGFLGLVGPSGSGKTTLARALAGAITPDAGLVRIDGIDVRNWPDERLAASVGYLPQSVQLLGGTVAENIRRLGPKDDEAVVEAATRSGALEMIKALPQGFETDVGDAGGALSGGQRAMIGMARAIYGRPQIVVLDEPGAHLDIEGKKALAQTLASLRDGKTTVVLVSHDLPSLRNFDMIALMKGGRIERYGPPSEIFQPNPEPPKPSGPTTTPSGNLVVRIPNRKQKS